MHDKEAPETVSFATSATLRHSEWRDELLQSGIRGKSGQRISFSRIESLPGRWLHAVGESKADDSGDEVREAATAYQPQRVVISFGPEHAALAQRQVEQAMQEAQTLLPQPKIVVFAAFQFDPEAAKDIDETDPKRTGMQFLKVQMNPDMQTDDLKKKRASNESFYLIGRPDIELRKLPAGESGDSAVGKGRAAANKTDGIADGNFAVGEGELAGGDFAIGEGGLAGKGETQYQVIVHGFDYLNTISGKVESGDQNKIAMWMLYPNYDGRSLFPRQVFFPMSGTKDGWNKLAKTLHAELDEELIQAYHGTKSLPFTLRENQQIAVKIVDDRGVESLRVVSLTNGDLND